MGIVRLPSFGLGFGVRNIWDFPKIRGGVPYFGVLMIRILVFRVLYWGPLFSEAPISSFWTQALAWISHAPHMKHEHVEGQWRQSADAFGRAA